MHICRGTLAAMAGLLLMAGSAGAKPRKPTPAPTTAAPAPPAAETSAASPAPAATPAPAPAASGRDVVQRESKIEFDERLVQGQTAAGAIYLFQRGESEFNSMVKVPESFRERTIRRIFPLPAR
jgi:hypothetical protein